MIVRAEQAELFLICQGRRYAESGRLFFNPSGAGFKGRFRGKALSLALFSEPIEKGRNAYIRLTLDGRTRRSRLPHGEKTLSLALSEGEHSFEVVKLTESQNNSLALVRAETEGFFLPQEDTRTLSVEFIGDSITAGFGVLAKSPCGEYKTSEQDVTKAFPHLVSRALGARYHIVAAGGWPIWRSKYSPYAIPDFYDHVDLLRNADKWDFSRFRPDVIVVTLGTNDYSYLADLPEEERRKGRAEVKTHFLAFIRRLLKQGVPVVLVYGFFDYPDLGVMTEEVAREIGSDRISTLEVRSARSLDDVCAGHPGKKTHRLAASRLTRVIRDLL